MSELLSIEQRLKSIRSEVPEGVEIVAVSKFHPVSAIQAVYSVGQRTFGESRVQELLEKIPQLPADVRWHFIGHLQTNKVRQLIGKTSLIESVDSLKLLHFIDEESRKKDVVTRVLLQVHVALEETKFGFSPDELREFFNERQFEGLTHTHISGLMAMASNTDDVARVRRDFHLAASLFREIADDEKLGLRDFNVLSMGMSGDWPLAVEEGANVVRIGSAIFGNRIYSQD